MFDYIHYLDAKARQQELAREVKMARTHQGQHQNRKPNSLTKRLRTFLTSLV